MDVQVLADQIHFLLPPGRWQAFCQALDAPPRVIPALRALLTAKGVFDGPENSPAPDSDPRTTAAGGIQ
jgi:hypothetical protein